MNRKMIGIRVDANKEIATGHVMRCIAIADKLVKSKCDVVFIVADHSADELITTRGYKLICLETKWNDMDTETEKLIEVIERKNIELIVITR